MNLSLTVAWISHSTRLQYNCVNFVPTWHIWYKKSGQIVYRGALKGNVFCHWLVHSVFRLTAIGLIRLMTVDMKLTTQGPGGSFPVSTSWGFNIIKCVAFIWFLMSASDMAMWYYPPRTCIWLYRASLPSVRPNTTHRRRLIPQRCNALSALYLLLISTPSSCNNYNTNHQLRKHDPVNLIQYCQSHVELYHVSPGHHKYLWIATISVCWLSI